MRNSSSRKLIFDAESLGVPATLVPAMAGDPSETWPPVVPALQFIEVDRGPNLRQRFNKALIYDVLRNL